MENNTAVKLDNYSNMSEKEFMLIQALVKEKLEQGEELEYEKFDGYELPPSSQFSMLKKPTVTFKYGKFRFNMAAINLFSKIKYILPMVHGDKKRLAVVPCREEESSTVEWARNRKKDDAWVNKDISSVDFVNKIFNMMGWKADCRYKIIGRIANSDKGLILLFDLEEALCFEPNKKEVVNPITGKTSVVNNKIYPKKYDGKIGTDYNDYVAAERGNSFEDLVGYDENSSVDGNENENSSVSNNFDGTLVSNKTTENIMNNYNSADYMLDKLVDDLTDGKSSSYDSDDILNNDDKSYDISQHGDSFADNL